MKLWAPTFARFFGPEEPTDEATHHSDRKEHPMKRITAAIVFSASLALLSGTAQANRTFNRQLFTLCTLGTPGSYGISDCEKLWNQCAASSKKWRRRNCRIQFYPGAQQQAQQLINQTVQQMYEGGR